MIKKWQLLDSTIVFNHPWYRLRQDTVLLPNGQIIDDYFVNLRPHIALILALTPEREVVFVHQYRHAVQQILLELPAGTFNPEQETPLTAAIRELEEETGYQAEQIIPLATLYDNPVKDINQIHLFLALNALPTSQQKLDPTEEIEVILKPISQVKELISTGRICVAGSISALYLGLNYLDSLS